MALVKGMRVPSWEGQGWVSQQHGACVDVVRRVLPPVYFLAALALTGLLHRYLPLGRLALPGSYWAGLVVLGAGGVLTSVANRRFKARGTTVRPFQRSTALVTEGVYRFTRNPMYVGLVLMQAGLALTLGSRSPWCVVAAFALAMDRIFIRAEERMLTETFGDAYRAYCRRVRRWL
jgi:protein-S-isoprenylcysteine O-methyltransferase Ste14